MSHVVGGGASVSEVVLGLDDGLRLAVRQWGPEHGSVRVLCLHGWLDNAATWDLLVPHLAGDKELDCRLVCMDFSGHGRSSHRGRDAHYSLEVRTMEVLAVADALGWQTFALLGHSMGAGVATCVAGTWPDRVSRLIVVDALGPFPEKPPRSAPRTLAAAAEAEARQRARQRRVYPSRERAEAQYLSNNPFMKPSSARILIERGTREVEVFESAPAGGEGESSSDREARVRGYVFVHDPRCVVPSLYRASEEDALEYCRRVKCPTLLFLATNELRRKDTKGTWLVESFRRRAGAVPDITVRLLEGSHHLHLDEADQLAPAVAAFLRDPRSLPDYGVRFEPGPRPKM